MDIVKKKIGVWGFGIVGKSVVNFLHARGCQIEIMEQRPYTQAEMAELDQKNISYTQESNIEAFLKRNDLIVPSPGIKIESYYQKYPGKWLAELDIFSDYFIGKKIGVTGSVGKTTITQALSDIMIQYRKNILVGGNIGTGMLDLVAHATDDCCAVIELSSFQLAYTQSFAPDLAIWTHFSENHLDWHGSMEHYFESKCALFSHQNAHQTVLLPLTLLPRIRQSRTIPSTVAVFSAEPPTPAQLHILSAHDTLFFIKDNWITKQIGKHVTPLMRIDQLPRITFTQNWLIIVSTLNILGYDLAPLPTYAQAVKLPEHRLEKCATINQVDFYNDSKATTPAATLAAVDALHNKPIILFLGGLSKGIDRTSLVAALRTKVKRVYCFGAEAPLLYNLCVTNTIPAHQCATLEEALKECLHYCQPGDQVLFSPAGSSFDLFKNYEHRGNTFKELIREKI
ncbi:MAG: UDP-N-acetylmuramoyl-L-alanine--D-glutamate ligase [bacterium]|nr:UDP-N-acetylmuramoyl-L-alanine--D-glutamate ligase [bacterium]